MKSRKELTLTSHNTNRQLRLLTELSERFTHLVADTDTLRQECFKLRYKVYCEENDWLQKENSYGLLKIEKDIYDNYSVHGLLIHKQTGLFAGTVRIILNKTTTSSNMLPIYLLCKKNKLTLPDLVPIENIGEVSRFCIPKSYRNIILRYENQTTKNYSHVSHSVSDIMTINLIKLLLNLAKENNILQWVAEMAPSLIIHLEKLGIYFDKVGHLINYYGMRQICYKKLDELIIRINIERPDIWNLIAKNS
ncbi:PEP-CTERM/exosortase system-associated acyltransferase [Salmonella enterica]|uniref:PEP-CTERM/exosortase system-associated acyltransferase n=1 Tax=Salmonella enterica TaxID=28901 RepID=UPI000506A0FE|nr:PEP-CTERM/exosortase system-associated acyltransferase [Salmonella enterica]EBY5128060.1 PEP-CTERM/exosortase system-associated acyltransferase [Salmonella enterica subsp. enterica serovar Brazzaville]ECE6341579.1 PEP-CTERM/exosortase system-associated acyltransferase [Salmonella enterica subsp. enterica]EDN7243264.1 PEP-CTERM/exosortase system-associated acyltransferase [Salmonella enterica subsp. enterica serovar Thompson]HBJ6688624.1 PEP-CTERM/exosortase system-associated acyltransferase 